MRALHHRFPLPRIISIPQHLLAPYTHCSALLLKLSYPLSQGLFGLGLRRGWVAAEHMIQPEALLLASFWPPTCFISTPTPFTNPDTTECPWIWRRGWGQCCRGGWFFFHEVGGLCTGVPFMFGLIWGDNVGLYFWLPQTQELGAELLS